MEVVVPCIRRKLPHRCQLPFGRGRPRQLPLAHCLTRRLRHQLLGYREQPLLAVFLPCSILIAFVLIFRWNGGGNFGGSESLLISARCGQVRHAQVRHAHVNEKRFKSWVSCK